MGPTFWSVRESVPDHRDASGLRYQRQHPLGSAALVARGFFSPRSGASRRKSVHPSSTRRWHIVHTLLLGGRDLCRRLSLRRHPGRTPPRLSFLERQSVHRFPSKGKGEPSRAQRLGPFASCLSRPSRSSHLRCRKKPRSYFHFAPQSLPSSGALCLEGCGEVEDEDATGESDGYG